MSHSLSTDDSEASTLVAQDSDTSADDSSDSSDGDEVDEPSWECARCYRTFPSAKALGGHRRSCINRYQPADVAAAAQKRIQDDRNDDIVLDSLDEEQYTKKAARMLSQLKEQDRLSPACAQHLKESTDLLHRARVRQLLSHVQQEVANTGTVHVDAVFENFCTLWPSLATTAQEARVIQQMIKTVKPVKRSLGVFSERQKVGNRKYRFVPREHFMIDFPLQEMLAVLLQVPGLIAAVEKFRAEFRESQPGEIRSFYDGIAYKHFRPLPHQHPDAYALITYGDGVTFTDPCSAYREHKLQMNYFALLELPPAFQGLSALVMVSQICLTSTLKIAGPRQVFGGAVDREEDLSAPGSELKELYHGVWMDTTRGSELVRAYVQVHAADTPEANITCGKMETCSKTKCFCRLCTAGQTQRLLPDGTVGFLSAAAGLGECVYSLRSSATDAAQHAYVQAGGDGKQYGISNTLSGETMFQDAIPRTHFCTSQGVPPDGMHIGAEGTLPTEMRRFLWWFSKATGIGPALVDEMIQKFPYHTSEKSDLLPPLRLEMFDGASFDPSKKLKCTAAQCLTLARNIVQIFLPCIEQHGLKVTPQWLSLVHLCAAWSLLMQPVYTVELLIQAELLISKWHANFKLAWGVQTAKPKHHFFLHLPLMGLWYGPMCVYWCFRFEAKHQEFKRLVQVSSMKNLLVTLPNRYRNCHQPPYLCESQSRLLVAQV